MKVIQIPDSSARNPYQKLLFRSLEQQGIDIRRVNTSMFFPLLKGVANHWKPDIVHIHWQHPFLIGNNFVASVLKSVVFAFEIITIVILGIPIIWTVHNITNHEQRYQRLELFFSRLLAKNSSYVIAHCEEAGHRIRDEFGLHPCDVIVIPHGNYLNYYEDEISQPEAKKILNIPHSSFVYLHFGQIRPYKGTFEVIDTFLDIGKKNDVLLIAGLVQDDHFKQQIMEKIGGKDQIRFFPQFIPNDKIQVYLKAADVVVFAFRKILTSGGVILAMSFGKPVIAPETNCIKDLLDDQGSFLYQPFENWGLARAMNRARRERDELSKMGNHNYSLVKELSWNDISLRLIQVYRRVSR